MLIPSFLLLGLIASVAAQAENTPNPTIPAIPTSTEGIPTIEGALVYDGPPVIGYTGPGGNATVQSNLPQATYVATLPSVQFDNATGSTISGTITGAANSNGTGVSFTISFAGFPSVEEYGPFVYHIHNHSLDATGNCTTALAHLDPTQRGELHACEVEAPQTCQAGDLAGKHGNITTPTFNAQYVDNYLSTDPSSPYFFGNVAIVIHSSNATRLTCANFTMSGATNSTGGSGGGSSTTSPVPTATAPLSTAAAPILQSTWSSVVGSALLVIALLI